MNFGGIIMSRVIAIRRCRGLLSICLALLLLAASCASAENLAVRVNDRVFSAETVQKYINESAANLFLTMGSTAQELFGDAQEEYLLAGAEHFVTVAIVEDRLSTKGLDKLSADEEESLQDYARQAYEQIWQSVSDQLKEEDPEETWTDRVITQTMEEAGYSMNGIYEKAVQNLLMERFTAEFCADVTVTDEEAREFYRTSYIQPDRELYENNIQLFEEQVLYGGESSTYIPEGYFYVKYIVLRPSEERTEAISEAESALLEANMEAEEAEAALTRAALENQNLDAARERYQSAITAQETATAMLEQEERLAEEDFAPMAELVRKALEDGDSFESLIGQHSVQQVYTGRDEPGFPFHPSSPNWEDGAREKIAALAEKGDCTDPIYMGGYVVIYCRMADMTCGEYEPDEETWASFKDSLLLAKQNNAINEKVALWRNEYDIEIDLTCLTFPEE